MWSDARSWQSEAETGFIEALRARYENEGFVFTTHPERTQLPEFLGSYIPDALAQKPGQNLAIEVKRQPNPSTERNLRRIRQLFDGQAEWGFHVVFMGADPLETVTIPAVGEEALRNGASEVRTLLAQGHRRAAFIMAWSLLEAALRERDTESAGHPRTAGTIVQTLAMNGYIEPDVERRIRALVDLRNRIVHGDLAAEPTQTDVEALLSGIEQAMSVDVSEETFTPS